MNPHDGSMTGHDGLHDGLHAVPDSFMTGMTGKGGGGKAQLGTLLRNLYPPLFESSFFKN